MRWLPVTVVAVAGMGCGGAKLRTANHVLLGAAASGLACDYGQTTWAARQSWTGGRYEANPALGESPSVGRITAYFAAIGLLAIASTELPEWMRLPLYAGTLAVETRVVVRNSTLWGAPWCGLN